MQKNTTVVNLTNKNIEFSWVEAANSAPQLQKDPNYDFWVLFGTANIAVNEEEMCIHPGQRESVQKALDALAIGISNAYDCKGTIEWNGHSQKWKVVLEERDESSKKTVYFGRYIQSGAGAVHNDPIEWIVLDDEDGVSTLLSKKGLVTSGYWLGDPNKAYKDNGSGLIWECSAIKGWLNESFYNMAFNAEEQEKIVKTKVKTIDESYAPFIFSKVFLLSEDEVVKNFPLKEDRLAEATRFAAESGALIDKTTNGCIWWVLPELGDTGMHPCLKAVYPNGEIHYHSRNVAHKDFVIRPAIRIKSARLQEISKKVIPLDDRNIYFMTVFERGTELEKISIDKELAEDSHYELDAAEAKKLHKLLTEMTGEKTLDKCLRKYLRTNSDITLSALMSDHNIRYKQFHFY